MELTDTTRMDILAPKPQHRSIMVTSYYPVGERRDCDWTPHKYMPDKSAALFSKSLSQEFGFKVPLGSVRLQMCHLKNPTEYDSNVSDFAKTNFPLVLFSPGDSSSRLFHGAQAQAIASLGYVVVTIVSGTVLNLLARMSYVLIRVAWSAREVYNRVSEFNFRIRPIVFASVSNPILHVTSVQHTH
jgi:hypothetical protein